jgi:hypothetical protein
VDVGCDALRAPRFHALTAVVEGYLERVVVAVVPGYADGGVDHGDDHANHYQAWRRCDRIWIERQTLISTEQAGFGSEVFPAHESSHSGAIKPVFKVYSCSVSVESLMQEIALHV